MSTRLIGETVKRSEDRRLLTGMASFIDDIELADMAHATVLRSPHAKADILKIDTSKASESPGVLKIITSADLGKANLPMPLLNEDRGFIHPRTHQVLASDCVKFSGEAIALVVAEKRYLAEDALELIEVTYSPSPATIDLMSSSSSTAPLVHADTKSNIACETTNSHGDIKSAFKSADIIIKEELRPERGCAQPMETRGVVSKFDDSSGHFTIWDTTQIPTSARNLLAERLEVPESKVTVIAPDVGGGFGVKIMLVYPEEFLIPFVSRLLHRPIKWIEDRQEHFLGSNHERLMIHQVELAATNDGHILGLRDIFYYDTGAYCPYGPINAECCQAVLPGPYKIPAIESKYIAVYTNTPIVSPYRGAGQPHGTFVIETMMNRLADRCKIDPAEARRKNLVTPEDCPFDGGTVFQYGNPLIHQDCDYPSQLNKLLHELNYKEFKQLQLKDRERGVYRGVGIAFYVEGTGIPPYEGVEVRVESTGTVYVATGYPSQGQSHHTTLAQIVADTIGIQHHKVIVESGRTDRFQWGVGTFASRAAVVGGTAALKSAQKVRKKILNLASEKLEVSEEDIEISNGLVKVIGIPESSLTFGELATAANPIIDLKSEETPGLQAIEYYSPVAATFSSGIHGLILQVDIETGQITIDRYIVVHDCGRMINPKVVEGQILGAVAQGIGGAFFEKLVFDENGQLLTTTFMDYLIPTAMEIPKIEIHHLNVPSTVNPLGVKGVGEGGVMPVAPAMSAAVENALAPFSAHINSFPFDPPKLLELIEGSAIS